MTFALPFAVWMLRGFLVNIPKELEEAAMVDGSSRVGAFFRILLPLVAPGLVATSVFVFITSWNEFIFAYVLLNDQSKQTVTVWLSEFYGTSRQVDWGGLMAGSILAAIPVLIFFVFVQRKIAFGLTSGAVKALMAEIVLDRVTKEFDNGFVAIDDISLTVADGEFLVLVGPSGCGKSTLLRMIAGLEEVTAGTVSIGGRDVTELAPRHRDIAMVFQNYALYPHMDVRKNLGYGLKVRKTPKAEIDRRVERGRAAARPREAPRPQARRRSRAASASASRWGARSSASRPRS